MSLYKILGVAKNANKQEIKQAYRKLAQQFHPDKHTQSSKQTRDAAAKKFNQISAAHDTLVDDRKRAAYDLNPKTRRRSSAADSGKSQYRYSSNSRKSNTGEKDLNYWSAFLWGSLALYLIWNMGILEDAEGEERWKRHEHEHEERRKKLEREFEERRKKLEREFEKRWKKHERELEERRKKHERQLEEHRKRTGRL